jgi:hypothetical protein
MGPLFGEPGRTPSYVLPPGQKSYFPSAPEAEFYPKDIYNTELGMFDCNLVVIMF